jgi:hypothetical protein
MQTFAHSIVGERRTNGGALEFESRLTADFRGLVVRGNANDAQIDLNAKFNVGSKSLRARRERNLT